MENQTKFRHCWYGTCHLFSAHSYLRSTILLCLISKKDLVIPKHSNYIKKMYDRLKYLLSKSLNYIYIYFLNAFFT